MQHLAWGFGLDIIRASPTIYEWIDEDGNRHFSDREPDVAGWSERVIDEEAISTYRAPDHPAPQQRSRAPSGPSNSDDGRGDRSSGRQASPFSTDPAAEARCDDLLERIDAVQDELRAGYREPRGQRLRDRRRALRDEYRRDCG